MIVPAAPGVDTALRAVARDSSVTFTGVDEALDVQAYRMNRPRIGLYASYRASMDEGWTRFIFENYDIPFVRVFDQNIRSGQLRDRYDVLVIPAELSKTPSSTATAKDRFHPSTREGWANKASSTCASSSMREARS